VLADVVDDLFELAVEFEGLGDEAVMSAGQGDRRLGPPVMTTRWCGARRTTTASIPPFPFTTSAERIPGAVEDGEGAKCEDLRT
jgi:hypothetical protein